MELGEKIQISRKKKGMSQEDLANVLNVSRQAVQKWESGVSNPELNKVIELGRVLDVSLDWLLSEKDETKEEVVIEEKTQDSLEEIAPIQDEASSVEKTEPVIRKENPGLDRPKHSLRKVLIIGSVALLLVGGAAATAIFGTGLFKRQSGETFSYKNQSIVIEGYQGIEVVDGVSYAFGVVDVVKSLYIVGVDTENPSFLAEYQGYLLEDMLFGTFNDRRDYFTVTIPECELFETIGPSTLNFSGCTKLVNVDLPDNLKTLGEEAFRGCSSLCQITLPKSIQSLGKYAFMSCSSLEEITFEGTTKKWESITKGALIWDRVPANVVHCSDGDVPLQK